MQTIPLPSGLPVPVERFYKQVYGENLPLIQSVVLTGRAVIKPVLNIPLPARFVFVHEAGKNYRHYFEATWFGIPFMGVNEGIVDSKSFFEVSMGNYINDDPNTNQGANLALWAEAGWFPSIWVTDPRVGWQAVDETTAVLYVPYENRQESFVVRFNPDTGMVEKMEAMRYRNPGDKEKILWFALTDPGPTVPGSPLSAVGSAMWFDQGKPWAKFILESAVYNVDVQEYVRARGY